MPLDTDDLAPRPKPVKLDLEMMSIEALTELIETLEGEIAQIRDLIARKKNTRSAADALFKR